MLSAASSCRCKGELHHYRSSGAWPECLSRDVSHCRPLDGLRQPSFLAKGEAKNSATFNNISKLSAYTSYSLKYAPALSPYRTQSAKALNPEPRSVRFKVLIVTPNTAHSFTPRTVFAEHKFGITCLPDAFLIVQSSASASFFVCLCDICSYPSNWVPPDVEVRMVSCHGWGFPRPTAPSR